MTVKELYDKFEKRIPSELSEEWDNDGIMCSPDLSAEVRRVLVTLDVTGGIVDYAISKKFDLIISHHPILFKPLTQLNEENHVASKLIKLLTNGISVFSFHTRADKVGGGVNDILARKIGLSDVTPFGEGDLGRVGMLPEDVYLDIFADFLKDTLSSDCVRTADAYNSVKRVAVVGGDGKDFVRDAILAGADTYVSGRLSYNVMEDAADMGINLIEAGHYFTEFPVTEFFASLVGAYAPNASVEIADSNMIKTL